MMYLVVIVGLFQKAANKATDCKASSAQECVIRDFGDITQSFGRRDSSNVQSAFPTAISICCCRRLDRQANDPDVLVPTPIRVGLGLAEALKPKQIGLSWHRPHLSCGVLDYFQHLILNHFIPFHPTFHLIIHLIIELIIHLVFHLALHASSQSQQQN